MPACASCGETNPEGARYCSGCGRPLGREAEATEERRLVTVLFADLVGFTGRAEQLDPEDVGRVLRPYYARLREELERYGGTVEKFVGDAVMAVFGAPVAHEDDPERAVRAAFAIRETLAELSPELRVRIGVNTGEALVSAREGYGLAAGDIVNTCFRLQQAAPVDGILVGEATQRATEAEIEYRATEPVDAKGKAAPVAVWEAVRPRPGHFDQRGSAPLVGREQELELLVAAAEAVRATSAPRLLTLVGETGLGKTRLAWELSRKLADTGEPLLWRQGRCVPYGEGLAYGAFAEIVKAQAGILESDPAVAAGEKLARTVEAAVDDPHEAAWIVRHLRLLAGLDAGSAPPADRRGEAFAAWRRYVEQIASDGLTVLLFEDLQWADEGLLDLIEYLAEWSKAAPLLLLCTARPELTARRPGWQGVTPLEPLSQEDTRALLDSLLAGLSLEPALESALLARAAGNPLYAEEYGRMLADRGVQGGDLPLPESVQAIVAARLDELPGHAKAVLQDAAVFGRTFWHGSLAHMGGIAPADVASGLAELRRRGFVRPLPRSVVAGEYQLAFWHMLVRDVTYAQIPRARRAEKHARAAEWIERLASDRADLAEELAFHYSSAIEYARLSHQDAASLEERGRAALRTAGDRALALSAFPAAVRFYRAALALWPEADPARPQLLFAYGSALAWAEESGAEELAEARAALLAAGDRETASEADVAHARLLLVRGQRTQALELAERAVANLADAPLSRARAQALSNLCGFHMFARRAGEAIRVGFEALQLAEELGLDDIRAHTLASIGIARSTLGDPGGIADLERSIDLGERLSSPEVVRAYASLASVHANGGDLGRAFALYAAARRAAERFGDARGLRWLAAERLYEDYWTGDWDAAGRTAESLIAEAEGGTEHYMESDCRLVRAWIRLARGDGSGAVADTERALELAREGNDPQALLPALALNARALLADEPEQAVRVARELVQSWEGLGSEPPSFWVADLAAVLCATGRGEEIGGLTGTTTGPSRWLDAAELACAGDHAGSAELYAQIGALPAEAEARQLAARVLLAEGRREEADEQLRRALAFHRHVGATAYALEGQALLGVS
ncbi:MAG: AAA family ATPase [Gaiellaceae bacterium]